MKRERAPLFIFQISKESQYLQRKCLLLSSYRIQHRNFFLVGAGGGGGEWGEDWMYARSHHNLLDNFAKCGGLGMVLPRPSDPPQKGELSKALTTI